MSKYRELVYMVLDELKEYSDDADFTEEHIIFLLNKYRAFLLKQKYSDIKKEIPTSNYQTICLSLEKVDAISGEPCEGGPYLRTTKKIPSLINIGNIMIYPIDYYQGNIAYITKDRMRYVGYNKYLQNIIYSSLGVDNHLYFNSANPQFLCLENVKVTGIFEDAEEALNLCCSDDSICNILDKEFPLENALVPIVIELIVKELLGPAWRPKDEDNNASDDLSNLSSFIARNTKSEFQKQIGS
jgi:hypothetical protein